MMRVKNFLLLAILLAVMLTAGGCGGGDSGESQKPRVLLSSVTWDSNGNGLPDIFDREWGITIKSPDSPLGTQSAIDATAPARANHTFVGFLRPSEIIDVPDEDEIKKVWLHDIDRYAVDLNASVQYSAVFYDIYGGRALDFTPEVIVSPEGGSPLPLDVNLSCAENLGAIILSFTPKRDGKHFISIKNTEWEQTEKFGYIFDLIKDEQRNGLAFNFVGHDEAGREFLYSPEEIMFLKGRFLDCVVKSDDYGFPQKVNAASADIAWKESLDFVNSAHFGLSAQANGKMKLAPRIFDVRRTSNLVLGTTFDVLTGYFAQRMEAPIVENIVLSSDNLVVSIDTSIKHISNQNEHAEELSLGGMENVAVSQSAVDLSNEDYKNAMKYGEFSTTMLLKWEMKEVTPRVLPTSQYKLTQRARDFLAANGSEKFREKWGDYFVAGERRGASYLAMVTVVADSSALIEMIKQTLTPSLYKANRREFQFMLSHFSTLSGIKISVVVKTHGGSAGDSPHVDPTNLMANLDKFIADSQHPNFVRAPLYVELLRFSQIEGGEKIDEYVKISPELFPLNQKMARAYVGLRAALDTLDTIPTNRLRDPSGRDLSEFRSRFATLDGNYQNNHREICYSVIETTAWINRFDDMRDEFRVFLERYGFYRKIMNLRSAWKNGGQLGNTRAGESIGYSTYVSAAVNNDINQGLFYSEEYHQGWGLFVRRYWYPEWDVAPKHQVICYIRIRSESNNDNNHDNNAPSIGNQKLKWYFQGGETRDANWFLTAYSLPLGNDFKKYPFNWDVY